MEPSDFLLVILVQDWLSKWKAMYDDGREAVAQKGIPFPRKGNPSRGKGV